MIACFRPTLLAAAAVLAAAPAFAAAAAPVTYTFGKESLVEYVLVHPAHTIHGSSMSLRGKVTVQDGKLVTPLKLMLPLKTLTSGNANRDNNALLTLGAMTQPTALIEVTRFDQTSKSEAGGALKLGGTATGTLKLHGTTKPVTIPLSATVSADKLLVDATFTVSLTAHGIERPALVFVPTEDAVKVTVHGVATP